MVEMVVTIGDFSEPAKTQKTFTHFWAKPIRVLFNQSENVVLSFENVDLLVCKFQT